MDTPVPGTITDASHIMADFSLQSPEACLFILCNLYSWVRYQKKKNPLKIFYVVRVFCLYVFHLHIWCPGSQQGAWDPLELNLRPL